MDTYKKKYKGALARCKWLLSEGMISRIAATDLFRELMDNDSENVRREIINIFHSLAEGKIPVDINYADIFTWLEKQGEQKPAWSEEDEKRIKDIIYFLDTAKKHYASTVELDACINWLKSLKQRYTWKPSDEQIGVIEAVINNRSFQRRHLDSLYEQLKKLKE